MNRNDFDLGILIILAVIVIALIFCTSITKAVSDKQYIDITVKQGDTLWAYWQQYGQAERYDKWLYDTMQTNGMDTAGLYEGQILRVEVRE